MVQGTANGNGANNFQNKAPGSWAYNLVKVIVPGLLNETPDKAKGAADSWGYTMPIRPTGAPATTPGAGSAVNDAWLRQLNANDKFDYGWFSYSENDGIPSELTYDLSLEPGVYKVNMGMAEYWAGAKNRPYVFSVRNGSTVLARTLGELESTSSVQGRNTEELTIMLTAPAVITVSVQFDILNELNVSGYTVEEPQISWLAVEKVEIENKIDIVVNTSGLVTATAEYYPPFGVTLWLALYDGNGRMLSIAQTDTPAHLYNYSVSLNAGSAAYAKAFLWDSATFVPILDAKRIELR